MFVSSGEMSQFEQKDWDYFSPAGFKQCFMHTCNEEKDVLSDTVLALVSACSLQNSDCETADYTIRLESLFLDDHLGGFSKKALCDDT